MIVSVHQPQYIPWIGYFHKIKSSDVFVLLDNVQYKKREFQNRNKIRTKEGPIWLTVPVLTKGEYTQRIKDVCIDNTEHWERKHLNSMETDYHKAKYFKEHEPFFKELYSKKWEKLSELNIAVIKYLLDYLEIGTKIYLESELDITGESTERIVNICKKLGGDAYLSGAGGKDYMDEKLFADAKLGLVYQNFKHPEYPQVYEGFESHLSTVDMVFNCGKESMQLIGKQKINS